MPDRAGDREATHRGVAHRARARPAPTPPAAPARRAASSVPAHPVGVVVDVVGADLHAQGDDQRGDGAPPDEGVLAHRDRGTDQDRHRPPPARCAAAPPAIHLFTDDGEPREVRLALLHVCVPPFLRFLGHVEEQRGVARELLDAGEAFVGRVERAFSMRRASGDISSISRHHATVSASRSAERHDRVDEAHLECFGRVVLAAEEPDLLRLLLPDLLSEQRADRSRRRRNRPWARSGRTGRCRRRW